MKIYDISRELTSALVYPGDPVPYHEQLSTIGENGAVYNLSAFYSGCHSATHIDAPLHFVKDGKTTMDIPLARLMGECTVVSADGVLTGEEAEKILKNSKKNIILKGNANAFLSKEAAAVFCDAGVNLVGTDAQSIAPSNEIVGPHYELLSRGLVILEGLCLDNVPDGEYTLIALPLKIENAEGAPARAVLISNNE